MKSSPGKFAINPITALLVAVSILVAVFMAPHHEGVPYQTVRLTNRRNLYLYDLVVVRQGSAPVLKVQPAIVIESVSWNPARNGT